MTYDYAAERRPISRSHPRLFGTLERLKQLAKDRPAAYKELAALAHAPAPEPYDMSVHERVFIVCLVSAIEGDAALAKEAREIAMKYAEGDIRVGHETYGHDMARVAICYDLCHAAFSDEDKKKIFSYMDRTIEANVEHEVSVFHNGFYAYKNWGVGLISYATMHENPRAAEYLATLEKDVVTRAAPALDFGGAGGAFCEGYYTHYFLYEWLVFYEVARLCEGLEYYGLSPKFFDAHAIDAMFQVQPGWSAGGYRIPVQIGDAGRDHKIIHDRALAISRILCQRYPNDPDHHVVNAFFEAAPKPVNRGGVYKEFLWGVPTLPPADVDQFKLSHYSPAAGQVYARSSWKDDATHFFFHCSKRYTAHQHLDVGTFLIYKHDELVNDGGHYDSFDNDNCVNYYMRSIAHNVVLVYDPKEEFKRMRMGPPPVNDGGQYFPWTGTPMRHNGFAWDVEHFQANYALADIAELLAFEEHHRYVYTAGDCTRAYNPDKLENFTRQIVYLRPGTFLIFDRVTAKDPAFQKTWLLQCFNPPDLGVAVNQDHANLKQFQFTGDKGRMFVQTLLPEQTSTRFNAGEHLYEHHGHKIPPITKFRPRPPECRAEINAATPEPQTLFLHVLTTAESTVKSVPTAAVKRDGSAVIATVGNATVRFDAEKLICQVTFAG